MKNSLSFILFILLSGPLFGQVKFNLTYQPTTKVYTVSMLPSVSWASPDNLVSSAQVVFRVSSDKEFTPGITSLIEGLQWADNAYIENPAGADGYTFVCVSLAGGMTNRISFVADQELPLFSFINAAGSCAGKVELLSNDDPMVLAVRTGGYNVTQHVAVLGARGNAFSGLENAAVDCAPTSLVEIPQEKIVEAVRIAPVPADEQVSIVWDLAADHSEVFELVIHDASGKQIASEKVSASKGEHVSKFEVKSWQSGTYSVRFRLGQTRQTQSWNFMVMH